MSLEDKIPKKPSDKELRRRKIDKTGNDRDPENCYVQLGECYWFKNIKNEKRDGYDITRKRFGCFDCDGYDFKCLQYVSFDNYGELNEE